MSTAYLGEIRLFAGDFAPVDWLFCHGQKVSISSYDLLFELLGTTYGGDGVTTFGLPDLRGRVPVHQGQGVGEPTNHQLGTSGGSESVVLTPQQLVHSHDVPVATTTATSRTAVGNVPATLPTGKGYSSNTPTEAMGTTSAAGQEKPSPHENRQPYVALSYIIATSGVYP